VWVSTKPLITEEIWPGQGLNLGLPNDKPALGMSTIPGVHAHFFCLLSFPVGRLLTLGLAYVLTYMYFRETFARDQICQIFLSE
jgi:hypothetical protein